MHLGGVRILLVINHRRACAARVAVVVYVCLSVCRSVHELSHFTSKLPLYEQYQRRIKVKKYVGFHCVGGCYGVKHKQKRQYGYLERVRLLGVS